MNTQLISDGPAAAPAPAPAPAAPAAATPAPGPQQGAAPAAGQQPNPAPAPAAGDNKPTTPSAGEQLAPDPNAEFMKSMPEDLRTHPSLKKYSSVESLARGYLNAEGMIGRDKVPIPRDPNDREAWDAYYKAGGRPDDPKGYTIAKPDKLPEGVTWDNDMEGWWRQVAFETGLNGQQAQRLVDQYRDRHFASVTAHSNAVKLAEQNQKQVLARDWGSTYEAKRNMVNAAFSEMPEPLRAAIINGQPIMHMPEFSKWLAEVRSGTVGELEPRPAGENAVDNPQEIERQIAALRSEKAAIMADPMHPQYKQATAELTALYKRLYPQQQVQ
jgi:hypothetical protein